MSKKVYIGVGHGGSDSGAVGNGFKEKNLNLDVAKACMNYLKNNGVDVKISRTTDVDSTINSKVKEANSWGANLVIEIHNNSGGGDGAEVYYSRVGGMSKTLAQNVLNEICKLGQQNRGIKTKIDSNGRDYFGMIRDTDAPAILVECAFIDTNDVRIIDTHAERVVMGEAIAKGALTTLGVKTSAPTIKPDNEVASHKIVKGSKVKIVSDATKYYNGTSIPAWVKQLTWIVDEVSGDRAVINKSTDGKYAINSPINVKFLTVDEKKQTFKPYIAKVTVSALNIRKGPGTKYGVTGCIRDRGVYTIVEESSGFGKLKSGAGWICLDYVKKV